MFNLLKLSNLTKKPILAYSLNLNLRKKELRINKIYNKDYLNLLPPELFNEIILNLSLEDLAKLAKVYPQHATLYSFVLNKFKIYNLNQYHNKIDILMLLFTYKENLDQLLIYEILNWASSTGKVKIINLILNKYQINISYSNNLMLRYAAQTNRTEIVKLLLSNPNFDYDKYVLIAAEWATEHGYIKIVKILLSDPRLEDLKISYSDFDKDINDILLSAIKKKYFNIVKILVSEFDVDPKFNSNQAFIKACEYGAIDIVKYLLNNPDVDPADQNNKAIIEASRTKSLTIVRLLLADPKVDPTTQNNIILQNVIKTRDKNLAELLLEDPRIPEEFIETNKDKIIQLLGEKGSYLIEKRKH